MTPRRLFLLACLIVPGLFHGTSAAPAARREFDSERYKIIYEQNIFSKNRTSSRAPAVSDRPERRVPVVLSLYILRGIAVNERQRIAFVEEAISGQTIKVAAGAELLAGRITEVGFDHVVFTEHNEARMIQIGESFGKTETLAAAPADTGAEETDASQGDDTAPAPETPKNDAAPSGGDDLLKKLLERRKSELEK